MRILVVEDEKRLSDAIVQILSEARYQTDAVYNGDDALDYALSGLYDAAVLDVMLPGKNGYEVVHELRRQKCALPVIMLTARSGLEDKITGLDSGADDYMTKPFEPGELLARLRALTRRQGDVVLDEMKFDDLTLNLSTYDLSSGQKSVHLGFKEFEVLRLLMAAGQAIVPKEDLIVKVWGADSDAEDNNVEAYISFLRKKIAFVGSRVTVATKRKVGYRLEIADDAKKA